MLPIENKCDKDTHILKTKQWKKRYCENRTKGEQEKARLRSDIISFKIQTLQRHEYYCYDQVISSIRKYKNKYICPQHWGITLHKAMLLNLKKEINYMKNELDPSTPLSPMS